MHVLAVFEKTTLKALQICKSVHPVLIKITIEGPRLAVTASEETPETVDPGEYGLFLSKVTGLPLALRLLKRQCSLDRTSSLDSDSELCELQVEVASTGNFSPSQAAPPGRQ